MDYIVAGVNQARMVTSLGRPRPGRNAHSLRGEVIEVTREGRDRDKNGRNGRQQAFSATFGYAGGALDEQAILSLKVRTNQDLSDLVGKRVIVTVAE
jgi:hypothetical protein